MCMHKHGDFVIDNLMLQELGAQLSLQVKCDASFDVAVYMCDKL